MSLRLPIPRNKILLFTLAGALLTGAIAVGLAYPGFGAPSGERSGDAQTAAVGNLANDAPEPNQNFTPQVADGGNGEHEEYEEHYEDEEYEEEHEDYEEYEEHEEEEEHEKEYEYE